MTTESNQPPSRQFLAFVLAALLLALFGSFIVMYYLGSFTDAEVRRETTAAYRIAYLPHTGAYNEIEPVIEQVREVLQDANVKMLAPCAIFLDDTSSIPEDERHSKVGFIVERTAYIPGPLEVEDLQPRDGLIATFDGGAMMGSYKAYAAMRDWARDHGYALKLPALEIYHPDEGWSEYHLSIEKR